MLISKEIDAVIIATEGKKEASVLTNLLCKNNKVFASDGHCAYSMPATEFDPDEYFPTTNALPRVPQDWTGLIPAELMEKAIRNRQKSPRLAILDNIQVCGDDKHIALTTAELKNEMVTTTVTQPNATGFYPETIEELIDAPAKEGAIEVCVSLENLDKLVKIMRKLKQNYCTLTVSRTCDPVHVSFPDTGVKGLIMPMID